MISPEQIRRFPYFAGLSEEQIVTLARSADEMNVKAGTILNNEGDDLAFFYLILDGEVAIFNVLPQKDQKITISTLGSGDVFNWSALVPPYASTAGVKAETDCRLLAFDCRILRPCLEIDPQFGYVMMVKIAQIIRQRLRDLRIETLAYFAG